MFNRNADIKKAKEEAKIPHWAICEKLGISEGTWYRKLRSEMSPEQKELVFSVINELKAELEITSKN